MRPLTEEETKIFFEKLSQYVGRNIKYLIDRPDEDHVFRLQKERVYYVSESLLKRSTNIGRKELVCIGTNFGKFTKGKKFRLHITALDYVAQFAKYKVWIKPGSEMSYLYGNNILKAGLARMTEDVPQYAGVVVCNMQDVPLGFGVASKSTAEARVLDPAGIVVFHQSDCGEYLRDEAELL